MLKTMSSHCLLQSIAASADPRTHLHPDAPTCHSILYKLFLGSFGIPTFNSASRFLLLMPGAFSPYSVCCCVTFLRSNFADHPAGAVTVQMCLCHSLSHTLPFGTQFSHGTLCTFPHGAYHSVISHSCACFLIC